MLKKAVEEGNDTEFFLAESREDLGKCIKSLLLRGTSASRLKTIVHEEDVVATEAGDDALGETVGGHRAGIETADGPADDGEAMLFGRCGDVAGLKSHGGTKEHGRHPRDVGEDALGFADLAVPVEATLMKGEAVVIEGVVCNRVLLGDHAADERGVGLGEASDDEKGGGGAMLGENIEQARGKLRMRAIIEGECDGIALRE